MNLSFHFDHSKLVIPMLHKMGIQSVRWLEEVMNDSDTQIYDLTTEYDEHPVHMAVGFSYASYPIKYIFEREGDTIRSLYARWPTKEEIKKEFCRYCGG